MKKYEYATVMPYNQVELFSTDSKVVTWLVEELKKKIPSCHIQSELKDLADNTVFVKLEYLSGKDLSVGYWVMQQFCQNGWEPFAHDYGNGKIHFRLQVNN
jgi:hypothetical protein